LWLLLIVMIAQDHGWSRAIGAVAAAVPIHLLFWSMWRPHVELRGEELHVVRAFSRVEIGRRDMLGVDIGRGRFGQLMMVVATTGGPVWVPAFQAWDGPGDANVTRRAVTNAVEEIRQWLADGRPTQ